MLETSTPTLATNLAATNLCYYRNVTSLIQIIRLAQVISQRFEKVVFPGERMLFYATSEASLDIYTNVVADLTLVDQIPCSQLQVIENKV